VEAGPLIIVVAASLFLVALAARSAAGGTARDQE
jgi:hypothetical protein